MKYLLILNDPPYGTERSYNALRLARNLLARGMDARGIGQADLLPGARRGSLDEVTEWTVWADKVLVF
jgi:uncharacterized protein involved in oxidation of intracellular sulfur